MNYYFVLDGTIMRVTFFVCNFCSQVSRMVMSNPYHGSELIKTVGKMVIVVSSLSCILIQKTLFIHSFVPLCLLLYCRQNTCICSSSLVVFPSWYFSHGIVLSFFPHLWCSVCFCLCLSTNKEGIWYSTTSILTILKWRVIDANLKQEKKIRIRNWKLEVCSYVK